MCSALPTDSASPSLFRALLDAFDYINVPPSDELDLGPPHSFSPSLPLKETSDGPKAHAMATFGGACPCGAQGSPGERPAQHSHGSAWGSARRRHNARNNRAATGREPRTLHRPLAPMPLTQLPFPHGSDDTNLRHLSNSRRANGDTRFMGDRALFTAIRERGAPFDRAGVLSPPARKV